MGQKVRVKINPIGIFDSGVGGLTVLKAVTERLPDENILYFGDTAHLPYGSKSPAAIKKYSLKVGEFFKFNDVKLMVVACNTASVYALDILREELEIPVIGVVESGANAALIEAKNSIGIIGTYGTMKSGMYKKMIRSKNPDIKIYSQPCPLFVPLVEEGWINHPVTKEVAEIYLSNIKEKIDTIILACTHYPLIRKVISHTLGPGINIVDSAQEVAKAVEEKMVQMNMLNDNDGKRKLEFYVSDAPDSFVKMGKLLLGYEMNDVHLVEIT